MSGLAFRTLGGEGADLWLIHGYGSDRLSWLGNSPALMTVARVHALDLPGHGDSPVSDGEDSLAGLARSVEETVAANSTGKVHVVGHSLGAGLALLMAEAGPERFRSLTLISPAGLGRTVDRSFLEAYPDLSTAEEATALLQRLVVRPQLINKLTVQRVLSQLDRPGAREALRKVAASLSGMEPVISDAAAAVSTGDLPRLTIWGEKDSINPLDATRLAAFGGESLVIPGAGHLPHIEAAKPVNDRIVSFLQSIGNG
jgi:pimeloyl-ACP methyl ester carboxylesterase